MAERDSWLQLRGRLGRILGRPVPSHEFMGATINEALDLLEARIAAAPSDPDGTVTAVNNPPPDRSD